MALPKLPNRFFARSCPHCGERRIERGSWFYAIGAYICGGCGAQLRLTYEQKDRLLRARPVDVSPELASQIDGKRSSLKGNRAKQTSLKGGRRRVVQQRGLRERGLEEERTNRSEYGAGSEQHADIYWAKKVGKSKDVAREVDQAEGSSRRKADTASKDK
jgi:hypothetical protein